MGDNSISNLAPISSGPDDLLILSSFNVSNIMFSVTFSSSIGNLLFTLGVVGIDPVCSVVNTLEKYFEEYLLFLRLQLLFGISDLCGLYSIPQFLVKLQFLIYNSSRRL